MNEVTKLASPSKIASDIFEATKDVIYFLIKTSSEDTWPLEARIRRQDYALYKIRNILKARLEPEFEREIEHSKIEGIAERDFKPAYIIFHALFSKACSSLKLEAHPAKLTDDSLLYGHNLARHPSTQAIMRAIDGLEIPDLNRSLWI